MDTDIATNSQAVNSSTLILDCTNNKVHSIQAMSHKEQCLKIGCGYSLVIANIGRLERT